MARVGEEFIIPIVLIVFQAYGNYENQETHEHKVQREHLANASCKSELAKSPMICYDLFENTCSICIYVCRWL